MDKVKHFLGLAAKYHFWILCGVVALMTLGSWYTTTAGLKKKYEEQKQKLEGSFTKASTLEREPNHPNNTYLVEMDRKINDYKEHLRRLWEKQYQEQGVNLQWPVATPTYRGLTPEFVEQVQNLRPIELTVPFDPTKREILNDNFKSEYVNFVKSTELPRLAKIMGSIWSPAQDSQSGTSPDRYGSVDAENGPTEIVHWHAENQAFLQDSRFDWRNERNGRPSTLQILYAQEDLWVLETLINIIAKTNADADARHNAIVKEVKYFKLGADAVGKSGQVTPVGVLAGAVGPDGRPIPGAPGTIGPTGPTAPVNPIVEQGRTPYGTPGAPGTGTPIDPAEGRYVDMNYEPIPPQRLRAAFTSNDPNEAFLAVAKRMPIRMHMVVDQRYLNRLLAECGNSNLIVEIRQVRINREVWDGSSVTGGAVSPGRVEGTRGGFAGGGERGRGVYRGGGESGEEEKPLHDIDVELYGIVYIYNPVNEKMVTVEGTPDAASANGEVAAPAPAPAPATTPAPVPENSVPAAPGAAQDNPVAPAGEAAPADPMNGGVDGDAAANGGAAAPAAGGGAPANGGNAGPINEPAPNVVQPAPMGN